MSTTKKRQAEDTPVQPKPKKSKKRKANAPDDELLDTELGLNTLFTKMDNQLLADHLAQKLGRFGTELSAVEISDMTVSGKNACYRLPFLLKISLTNSQPMRFKIPPHGKSQELWISFPTFWRRCQRTPKV